MVLMPAFRVSIRRAVLMAVTATWLASCGGGDDDTPGGSFGSPTGGGGGGGLGGGGGGGNQAPNVTISGTVTYDFVPIAGGLNYAGTEARPARLVTVQFVEGGTVLATTRTDTGGNYSISVPGERNGFIRVRAESSQPGVPGWLLSVVDNTSGGAVYSLDGGVLSSGSTDSTRDLHAPSGWTGAGYGAPRAAAPFAILDTLYLAVEFLVAADPDIVLPALNINWSPDNVASVGPDGFPDANTGEIGSSQYVSGLGIFLLGEENTDTEEYDRHIILHEFGHYLEATLGRSDSIGGPHTLGDRLDLRVAFSEGWATAFAAIVLRSPVYRDTGGPGQGGAFGFNIETEGPLANPAPGFYSEQSIWELVYDLYDSNVDGVDSIAYSFAELWAVTTDEIASSLAVTSVFPFLNAVKAGHPLDQLALDQLAASQNIGSISTDFGDNETDNAGSPDVLPIHAALAVNGPTPVNLCSTDEFTSGLTGAVNKLGSRRFLRFTPPAAGLVTITLRATSVPPGEFADPDFVVHRQGGFAISDDEPDAICQNIGAGGWTPGDCTESAGIVLPAAEHVLEIYEWTNTNDTDDPDFPPIGRTCFDVTVTQP